MINDKDKERNLINQSLKYVIINNLAFCFRIDLKMDSGLLL